MSSVSFHLKDPKSVKPTTIFIWFNADGRRTKLYTGYKVLAAQWDNEEQKALTRGYPKENGDINKGLARMGTRLQEFYAAQRADGIIPSVESLKKVIEPEEEGGADRPMLLVDYADYLKRQVLTKQPTTIKSIRTNYNHVAAFVEKRRRVLNYDDLTITFYDGFTQYLSEAGLTDNSLSKQVALFKCFLSDALNRGRTDKQDFKRWTWSRREPDVVALSRDELRAIENLALAPRNYLHNARSLFLLSCYTGLRFSDVAALKPEHDRIDRLHVTTQKTRDSLVIPVSPKARALLDLLWSGEVHPITNQKLNEFLKELAQRACIDVLIEDTEYKGGKRHSTKKPKFALISSHTGRRTFVTLALESGLPWEVIMKVTGHKDMRSFKRYIQVTDDRQIDAFQQIWEAEELNVIVR